jgi:hypothetical protein
VFEVATRTLECACVMYENGHQENRLLRKEVPEIKRKSIGFTCAVTSSSFAHDNVSSLVVDDYTDTDEGALELRHVAE